MNATEFAVIADVHGNALALDAVLRDIARRGLTTIVNLGDNANGPLEPARSVELLRKHCAVHVRGNGDRMVGEGGATARGSALFARERLDSAATQWLRELPFVARGYGWIAFHATLRSDEEYFLENILDGKTVLASPAEIAARLGDVGDASLVLCGHTHNPRLVRFEDGRLVLNPGSVGLPAYHDDNPVPHDVETGSADARYAIARRSQSGWQAELLAVPYDVTAAATMARQAGWDAWARILATGRC